jgi:CheY-like chemotaxis protein
MAGNRCGSNRSEILYVDDCAFNTTLMEALFERRPDLSLICAVDGAEALDIAPSLRPCLLLLDLNLPDCRGTDLLRCLRRFDGYAGLTAVVVTSEHSFSVNGTGFAERWDKPLNVLQVLGRLDALVDAHRSALQALPPVPVPVPVPVTPSIAALADRLTGR